MDLKKIIIKHSVSVVFIICSIILFSVLIFSRNIAAGIVGLIFSLGAGAFEVYTLKELKDMLTNYMKPEPDIPEPSYITPQENGGPDVPNAEDLNDPQDIPSSINPIQERIFKDFVKTRIDDFEEKVCKRPFVIVSLNDYEKRIQQLKCISDIKEIAENISMVPQESISSKVDEIKSKIEEFNSLENELVGFVGSYEERIKELEDAGNQLISDIKKEMEKL